jgi:ribosomal protein L40E
MAKINVTGHTLFDSGFCPKCGARNSFNSIYSDESMKCDECGLVCYIIESDASRREESEELPYLIWFS